MGKADLFLARIEGPEGRYADVVRSEKSEGENGDGQSRSVKSLVRVFDAGGRELLAVERAFVHVINESRPDEITGTTIDAVRFGGGGRSIVLSLGTGEELVCLLPA